MTRKNNTLRNLALAGLIAGSASISGCDLFGSDDDSGSNSESATTPLTKEADFKADCTALGGMLEELATCNGSATCAGKSFIDGKVNVHDCAGKNTCAGLNCKLPTAG